MGDMVTLGKKLERAMRNGTGFNVTLDELMALSDVGITDAINMAKMKELQARCRAKHLPMSSENTGSTSAAMAPPPKSGKSPPIGKEAVKSYIAALSAEA